MVEEGEGGKTFGVTPNPDWWRGKKTKIPIKTDIPIQRLRDAEKRGTVIVTRRVAGQGTEITEVHQLAVKGTGR